MKYNYLYVGLPVFRGQGYGIEFKKRHLFTSKSKEAALFKFSILVIMISVVLLLPV